MNTREIAVEYRLAHWAEIMRERQESGLSIKAYCESIGIHQNVYFYWQRKLREAACQQDPPAVQEQGQTVAPNGWAVCNIEESEVKEQSVIIEIGKCKINATDKIDFELLSKICRVLASLC